MLGTTLAVVWAFQCRLEVGRASQRLAEAQAEGDLLEAAAAKQLALAESKLREQWKTADDRTNKMAQSESPTRSFKEMLASGPLEIDARQAEIAAAQQEVEAARQAVDDSLIAVDRLTRDAWLERKRAQRLMFCSIAVVAVGAVVTSATGWVWRRAQ